MGEPARAGLLAWPRTSAVGRLRARVTAELDAGSIPLSCEHADAPGFRLTLPGPVMVCHECGRQAPVPPETGPCAACGTSDGCQWTGWLHPAPIVGVVARICQGCADAGSVTQTWN